MAKFCLTVTIIGYFALGLLQWAAVLGGLEDWLGLHWLLAVILAFPISYMPIIGTVLGIFGAHAAWGWSWMQSIALFFAPMVIIYAVGLVAVAVSSALGRQSTSKG